MGYYWRSYAAGAGIPGHVYHRQCRSPPGLGITTNRAKIGSSRGYENCITHPCEGFAMSPYRFQTKTLFAYMILQEMKPSQGLADEASLGSY